VKNSRRLLALLLLAGLVWRILLAFVWYRGQGFDGDMNDFLRWAQGVAARGPGHFYNGDTSINYPPVSIYVLWATEWLSHPVAHLFGVSAQEALVALLKLPAILADCGIAAIAYRLARRLGNERAGLIAAALVLFAPVLWYVSALWGQIDSLLALASMAALLLLVEGRSELAAVAAVVAVLVKPQGLVCLVIVATVLVSRHRPRRSAPASDPTARSGGPARLLSSVLLSTVAGILLLLPFDLSSFASARWRGTPVIGDVVGLGDQFLATGRLFSVLTANAYNMWALVGPSPLVRTIGTGTATWQPDTVHILGVSAIVLGAVLLLAAWAAVTVGLMRRTDELAVLLGYTVLAVAFYTLPTRVHERYLVPAFAAGAVLAASWAVRGIGGYLAASGANLVNLHAVLAAPLGFGGSPPGGGGPFGGPAPNGGTPGPGGGTSGGTGSGLMPTHIALPFSSFARNEVVATITAIGQTLLIVVLLALWWTVVRPRAPRRQLVALDA
jgi:4-amino-4-deoxy-L-arabinose transferase-like glycosyltransferase